MSRELVSMELAERNQKFLDAEPKIDTAIQIASKRKLSMFRSKIARGTYSLGEGLEKKSYRFHPGLSQMRGRHLWHPVQLSKKAAAGVPGYDATKYNPHTVTYGFDSVTYGGKGIEYATPNISIRDLRFMWQIRAQLAAIFGFLGDFTNDMWENYARETYMKFCNDYSNVYVLSEGGATAVTGSYDPDSVDSDGDNTMTVTGVIGKKISTLNWKYMKYFSRYLQMQAAGAAIGNRDGRPTFGWIGDLEDFDRMIEEDPQQREDWRYFNAQMLIADYGSVTEYKGFNLMHEMVTPRWTIKSNNGTTVTFKRVDPYTDSAATLLGRRADVNPDYLTAEFGTILIFLNDVYSLEIPPSGPAAPGAGTSFGATPGLNGEWKWLNIQDAKDNPLNEIGFWFMRAEAFAKPGTWREEPIMIIYKRFVAVKPGSVDLGGEDAVTESGLSANAASTDVDATNNTVTLKLTSYLDCDVGDEVVVSDDDGTAIEGIVADASAAPTYVFALESAPSAYGKYTAAGAAVVTVVA